MEQLAWTNRYTLTQLERWAGAIPTRFSCRRYAGDANIDQKSALHYVAARVGLPGVRIVFSTCNANKLYYPLPFVGRVDKVTQYAAIIRDKGVPLSLLHAGIVGEALVLEATALGLGTCWIAGNYRKQHVDVALSENEVIVALIPFGRISKEESAAGKKRKPLQDLCLDDPSKWPNWAFQAAEAVRLAPSAFNAQPWRFSFTGSTWRMGGRGFPNVNFGIATLHALCALHAFPHTWRMTADGKGLLVAEEQA